MTDFFQHPPRPVRLWRESREFASLARDYARGLYAAEPKMNGWRSLVHVNDTVEAVSRHHRPLLLRPEDTARMDRLPPHTLLDGELMGGRKENAGSLAENFVPFDIVRAGGRDTWHLGYDARREALEDLVGAAGLPIITSWTADAGFADLAALYDRALATPGSEGLVLKRRDAPWRAGRTENDEYSAWIKLKRTPTYSAATCSLRP